MDGLMLGLKGIEIGVRELYIRLEKNRKEQHSTGRE